MTVWFDFMADTRHWELEPYFDVDGGRALALEDTEYVVYIEKPGPVELTVEKHGYDVFWMNPGRRRDHQGKKYSAATTSPASRPTARTTGCCTWCAKATLESMNRSYKFESRDDPAAGSGSQPAQGSVRHRAAHGRSARSAKPVAVMPPK